MLWDNMAVATMWTLLYSPSATHTDRALGTQLEKEESGACILPALSWSQATAFLSRSSHSHFKSFSLACSQRTASTVAHIEGSLSCKIDRTFCDVPGRPAIHSGGSRKIYHLLPHHFLICGYMEFWAHPYQTAWWNLRTTFNYHVEMNRSCK